MENRAYILLYKTPHQNEKKIWFFFFIFFCSLSLIFIRIRNWTVFCYFSEMCQVTVWLASSLPLSLNAVCLSFPPVACQICFRRYRMYIFHDTNKIHTAKYARNWERTWYSLLSFWSNINLYTNRKSVLKTAYLLFNFVQCKIIQCDGGGLATHVCLSNNEVYLL